MSDTPPDNPIQLDALIIGGGGAGLWLLDDLRRRGSAALLIERDQLGTGQTVCAQGIIHGGLKYTLDGLLHKSAAAIADMPDLWRDALAGRTRDNQLPDLSRTRVRSHHCYVWRTDSLASRLGMVGAKVGLRVKPEKLSIKDRPAILAACPGSVSQLSEQVIDPVSLIRNLFDRNKSHIVRLGNNGSIVPSQSSNTIEQTTRITLNIQDDSTVSVNTRFVILTAGAGNADLAHTFGLNSIESQARPLHMVMLRGKNLADLNGHCVDGRKTRATITSDVDSNGNTVWQVGGQLAEDGVKMQSNELKTHAAKELHAILPSMTFDDVEWATYRVDRAEPKTTSGTRPDDAVVIQQGNIIVAWPTKLALVPRLSKKVSELISEHINHIDSRSDSRILNSLNSTTPSIAPPPWEWNHIEWTRNH